MNDMKTLCSHEISSSSSFLHIIPSEILSIILMKDVRNTQNVVHTLILTSKETNRSISLAIPYIKVLIVSQPLLLNLFTGIVHLDIRGNICLRLFNRKIFRNLTYLNIHTCAIPELKRSLSPEFNNLTYLMPNLRCLSIYRALSTYVVIPSNMVPELRKLYVYRCVVGCLDSFRKLRFLSLTQSYVKEMKLNELKIDTLILSQFQVKRGKMVSLNISTLKVLYISLTSYVRIDKLQNLEILNVLNCSCPMPRSMRSLKSLSLSYMILEFTNININSISYPELVYVKLTNCKDANINSSVVDVVKLYDCQNIRISSCLMRLKCLIISNILPTRVDLEINNTSYPALEYIKLVGCVNVKINSSAKVEVSRCSDILIQSSLKITL